MSQVYEVIDGEYVTRFKEINIEDAGEVFLTQEELTEVDNEYGSPVWKEALIKRHITKAIKSIPENKMSVPLGAKLFEAFRYGTSWSYLRGLEKKGIRIERGRVYNKPPNQKKVNKSDFISLRSRVCCALRGKGMDVTFGINHGQCKMKLVQHFKKIVTWKEVSAESSYHYDRDKPDGLKLWIRKIWLDPTLVEGM